MLRALLLQFFVVFMSLCLSPSGSAGEASLEAPDTEAAVSSADVITAQPDDDDDGEDDDDDGEDDDDDGEDDD